MSNASIRILLVDDEPDILEIISYNLINEGYQVFTAENGKQAIKIAKKQEPHLIILDVMMPVMDGIEACQKIRQIPKLQDSIITFLTARAEDYAQISGLEAGADDYITKPIKPKVLVSKIKSLLRRLTNGAVEQRIEIGKLVIDTEAYVAYYNEEQLNLPRKEFELLLLLASRPDKVFKRDEILDAVWGSDVVVGGRTIDVHIRKLREKIGDSRFETVKGVGYKYVQ